MFCVAAAARNPVKDGYCDPIISGLRSAGNPLGSGGRGDGRGGRIWPLIQSFSSTAVNYASTKAISLIGYGGRK